MLAVFLLVVPTRPVAAACKSTCTEELRACRVQCATATELFLLRDRQRAVFSASGDPLGKNPSLTCQLFSIDVLAGHPRQLTRFNPDGTSPNGCLGGYQPPGCTTTSSIVVQDAATGAIVFDSTCHPFDPSAVDQQIYALRPNRSGFRQLTAYRRETVSTDKTVVDVELPGPMAYSASPR